MGSPALGPGTDLPHCFGNTELPGDRIPQFLSRDPKRKLDLALRRRVQLGLHQIVPRPVVSSVLPLYRVTVLDHLVPLGPANASDGCGIAFGRITQNRKGCFAWPVGNAAERSGRLDDEFHGVETDHRLAVIERGVQPPHRISRAGSIDFYYD